MRPGLGRDVALRLPLQGVIADRSRGRQPFLDVPWFKEPTVPICRMSPDSGEAVGLQFEAHRQRVDLFFGAGALLEGADAV